MRISELLPDPRVPGYPAAWSPDRVHRYVLWRVWRAVEKPRYVMFVGLNPSDADEYKPDPTLTRCIDFGQRLGFDALVMTNLYAFVFTDPARMRAAADPVGPDNDTWLRLVCGGAARVIVAWGADPAVRKRVAEVLHLLPDPHCLGTTKDGHPRHPLFLRADAVLRPYQPAALP